MKGAVLLMKKLMDVIYEILDKNLRGSSQIKKVCLAIGFSVDVQMMFLKLVVLGTAKPSDSYRDLCTLGDSGLSPKILLHTVSSRFVSTSKPKDDRDFTHCCHLVAT